MLVLISGLPGAGKSTVARALGDRLNAPVYSRDATRAQLSRDPVQRLMDRVYLSARGWYRPALQRAANTHLASQVGTALRDNGSVIVELIADPAIRHRLAMVAARHGAAYRQIECVCANRDELVRRLAGRPGDWAAVLASVEKAYVPPDPVQSRTLDTSRPVLEVLVEAMAYLSVP